jgi:hypothetical protein
MSDFVYRAQKKKHSHEGTKEMGNFKNQRRIRLNFCSFEIPLLTATSDIVFQSLKLRGAISPFCTMAHMTVPSLASGPTGTTTC